MKNIIKKILVGSISLIAIIIIIATVMIIKSQILKAERKITIVATGIVTEQNIIKERVKEVEEIQDIEIKEVEKENNKKKSIEKSQEQTKLIEKNKKQENTDENEKQNNKVTEIPSKNITEKVNDNIKKTETNKSNTQVEKDESSNSISNTIETNASNNTQSNKKIETYKYNKQITEKMVEIINSNKSDYMMQYGYSIEIDENIITNTNQFTFTEKRVKNLLKYKAGTIRVYARDYYVNEQYVWTECFIL